MAALRFDAEQRFTCAGCVRCCHAEVVIPPSEHAVYTRERVARWFRESGATTEGTERDPFVGLPGRAGWFRIRRRADGTCGFLSPQNRCRLHEELGGERKPLVCRMFPFAVHVTEREPVVTASFTCPTIVSNEGQPVPEQARALGALRNEWGRTFGAEPRPFLFAAGKPMSGRALDALRGALQRMVSAPVPLAGSVRKIAAWLDDLSRPKVSRLAPDDLAEYLIVTGRYAAESDRQVSLRRASGLTRVRQRGLLFVGGAAAMQWQGTSRRWRMVRLLLHAHGLGPALPELDVTARRRVRLDAAETEPLVRHYLRAAIETLGTGRRPVMSELARSAAVMNVAIALGAMDAARAGRATIGTASLREGLVRASELDHLQGALAAIVDSFAGGPESFVLLAESLEG
jgi:Fe-S-cluster containining protein